MNRDFRINIFKEKNITEHFRNIRFDVDVLQVTIIVSVKQSDGRVQPDRDPDSITGPAQLPDLTFLSRMSLEASLN